MQMQKASAACVYDGHTIKSNYAVDLKFRFIATTENSAFSFVQLIGKPVKLGVIIEDKKFKLGLFTIYRITIDNDGEVKILFRTQKENANLEDFVALLEDEVIMTLVAIESDYS